MRVGAAARAGTLRRMETIPAVACERLTKRFGETLAIADVSLAAQPGDILALLGPSGCGKTTFLRLIAGFETPDAGTIAIGESTVAGDGRFIPPEKRRVGFVFQDYALFPHLTVAANVAYGSRDRPARVDELISLVGLRGLEQRYPHELSGGQQQRVALARALAPEPRLVLLDEPFSNLDADLRVRVRTQVRGILRAARATAIFVTHDQDEAFDIADRIAVLRDGRVEQLGTAEEIYHTPASRFVADFVGEAEFLACTVEPGRILSELGSFAVEAGIEPGEAELMIRPEDIVLEADDDAGAKVIARRFQGPVNLTLVQLPSGAIVTAAHSSQRAYDIRARVRVTFRPDHLVLFRGEQRAAWCPVR